MRGSRFHEHRHFQETNRVSLICWHGLCYGLVIVAKSLGNLVHFISMMKIPSFRHSLY